jgi:hypothetical protein
LTTRAAIPVLIVLAPMLLLGGCTDFKRALGMERVVPDEFAVVSRAPLALPPDYSLRPPKPGADPTQEIGAPEKAREAVFRAGPQSQGSLPAAAETRSAGEGALLKAAGVADADPNIRAVMAEDKRMGPDISTSFVDRLEFWHKNAVPPSDQVINPGQEAERMKQAQATGQPAPPGAVSSAASEAAPPANQPLPTIERRKSSSFLDNIF